MSSVNLKILSDYECKILIDSEYIATANVNSIYKIPLSSGEYWLQLICVSNPNYIIEQIVSLDNDKVLKVSFADLMANSPAMLRDEELMYCAEEKCYKHILTGQSVTPSIYDEGGEFVDGIAKVRKGSKWGYIDKENNEVVPCIYDVCEKFTDETAKVSKDNKWGYIDKRGRIVIPCVYDKIESFVNGKAKVRKGFRWGYVDQIGKEVISCVYSDIGPFINNRAKVKRDGKYGYINDNGFEVIRCKYEILDDNIDGTATVRQNKKWGKIDLTNGSFILPCICLDREMTIKEIVIEGFDCYGRGFCDGLLRVKGDRGYGYINEQQQVVVECKYEEAEDFKNGIAAVKHNGKWGCINTEGSLIIPFLYDEVEDISEYIIILKKADGWYCFEKSSGRKINEVPYEEVDDGRNLHASRDQFIDDRIPVSRKGRWGYINKRGEEVIPCRFETMRRFSNGLCAVKMQGQYGCIDVHGTVVADFIYKSIDSFEEGVAWVENQQGLYGLINLKGEEITSCQYNCVGSFLHGMAVVSKKVMTHNYGLIRAKHSTNRFLPSTSTVLADGVIDNTGREIIPCSEIHKEIEILNSGLILVNIFRGIKEDTSYPYGNSQRYCEVRTSELQSKSGVPLLSSKREQRFEFISRYLYEGLIGFWNDKWGVIDSFGNQIIEYKYEDIGGFRNGLAPVKIRGKWGFIDTKGNIIIAPKYESVGYFYNGYAIVKREYKEKYGIIDSNGREIVVNKYDEIKDFRKGYAVVKNDDNYGLINTVGEELLPCEFEYLENSYSEKGLVYGRRRHSNAYVYTSIV